MRFAKTVRLPLQSGATSLKLVYISFLILPFSVAIFPFLIVYLYARDARRRRASDIVFDADRVSIVGGPMEALSWAWADIDLGCTTVEMTDELLVKHGNQPAIYHQRLLVDGVEVARGADDEEVLSFWAIVSLIKEGVAGAPPPTTPLVAVLCCPACGAPLPVGDAAAARCSFCAASVPVPAAMQAAARDAAAFDRARHRVDARVRRALAGGSAALANVFVLLTMLSGLALIPLEWAIVVSHQPSLLPMPLLLPVLLSALARTVIARRVAARGLVVGCAAIAPTDPTHSPRCRRCRAPLAPAEDAAICTCVYCRTTNVLGIQLGAREMESDVRDLEAVLHRHRRSVVSAWIVVAGVVAFAGGMWMSARG